MINRKSLICLLLTLAMLVSLCACSSKSDTAAVNEAPSATEAPVTAAEAATSADESEGTITRGGVLTLTKSSDLTKRGFDPTQATSTHDLFVFSAMWDTILTTDADGKIIGKLATAWEYTEDGLGLILHLREDACWSDGTKFNAENAAYVINYYITDECNHYYKGSDLALVTGVDVIDEYTIQINTSSPDGGLLTALTGNTFLLMAPSNVDNKDCATNPIGIGPFKLADYVEGDHVTLVKNENYFEMGEDGQPLPYLDGIEYKIITDDSVRVNSLKSGDVDGVDFVTTTPNVFAVMSLEDVITYQSNAHPNVFISFNFDNAEMAKDQKVRDALSYAIDRQEIVDVVYEGLATIAPFFSVENQWWYYNYTKSPEYDPAKAKELLAEAGYPDGITLELANISREPDNTIAQLLQSQMAEAGITIEINTLEIASWRSYVKTEKLSQIALCASDNLGADVSRQIKDPLTGTTIGNYDKVAEIQAMFTALKSIADQDERYEAIKTLQEFYYDNTMQLFLLQSNVYCAFKSAVKNVQFTTQSSFNLAETWIEQ